MPGGRLGVVVVHTIALMIVRRVLGVLGCGPDAERRCGGDRRASSAKHRSSADLPIPPGACKKQLRKTLTWDCGKELSGHAQFALDTGTKVYLRRSALTLATTDEREH